MKIYAIKKGGLSVAILLLGIISVGFAQTPSQQNGGAVAGQTLAGVELKGKVPVNREPLKIKLPPTEEATLPNGLRIVVLENHKVPTFSMQAVVLSGGLSDPATQRGLATFTANLLRQGTATRSSREISEQLESLGASLGASSGMSSPSSSITLSGLTENLETTLDIFADVVRNANFPADEVERLKSVFLPQLQGQRTVSMFLAQETLYRKLYGEHPAALVTPSTDAIKSFTPADLTKFHQTFYRPNNMILLISGDVSLKEIKPLLEKKFGDWQKADVPQPQIADVSPLGDAHITIVNRPGSVQTAFLIGNLGIRRDSADYFPLVVMDQIYGADSSSRLFRNLREEKGYTYGAYSSFTASKFTGNFVSRAEVRNDVTEGAFKEFMYEMKRLRDEPIPVMDLENAKRALVGNFAISLEQPAQLLQYIVTQKLYGFPADYWANYPKSVAAVTAEDVRRVAQKYIDLPHLQVVAVGDASKIRPILEKYGTVEVISADGKAMN